MRLISYGLPAEPEISTIAGPATMLPSDESVWLVVRTTSRGILAVCCAKHNSNEIYLQLCPWKPAGTITSYLPLLRHLAAVNLDPVTDAQAA
jgi:hypothetical protein